MDSKQQNKLWNIVAILCLLIICGVTYYLTVSPISHKGSNKLDAQPSINGSDSNIVHLRQLRELDAHDIVFSGSTNDNELLFEVVHMSFSDIKKLMQYDTEPLAGMVNMFPYRSDQSLSMLVWTPRAKLALLIDISNRAGKLVKRLDDVPVSGYNPSGSSTFAANSNFSMGVTNENGRLELKIKKNGKFTYLPWNESLRIGERWLHADYPFAFVQLVDSQTNQIRKVAFFDMENARFSDFIDLPANTSMELAPMVLDPSGESAYVFSRKLDTIMAIDYKKWAESNSSSTAPKWMPNGIRVVIEK